MWIETIQIDWQDGRRLRKCQLYFGIFKLFPSTIIVPLSSSEYYISQSGIIDIKVIIETVKIYRQFLHQEYI